MHTLMSVFHTHIQEMEQENMSIMEVKKMLNNMHTILLQRKSNNFMSLKEKGLLAQKRKDGLDKGCDQFCADVHGMYKCMSGISGEVDDSHGRVLNNLCGWI